MRKSLIALLILTLGTLGCGSDKSTDPTVTRPAPEHPDLSGKEPIVQEDAALVESTETQ